MQVATGPVVGGKVVLQGDPLPRSTVVTLITREGGERFVVLRAFEAELLGSIVEADRAGSVPAGDIFRRLRRQA